MSTLTPSSSPITPGSGANVATFTDGAGKLYQGIVLVDANGVPITVDPVSGGVNTFPSLEYSTTPSTLANGQTGNFQGDSLQNLKVSVQSQFAPQQDGISSYNKPYKYVNLATSGQLLSTGGVIAGWFVNTIAGNPTIRLADNASSSASGYLGAAFTPVVGFTPYGPCEVQSGGYVTITIPTGASIDITFFVRNGLMA